MVTSGMVTSISAAGEAFDDSVTLGHRETDALLGQFYMRQKSAGLPFCNGTGRYGVTVGKLLAFKKDGAPGPPIGGDVFMCFHT